MIYAKVYGCIRMHIDCRLGSAIFIKIFIIVIIVFIENCQNAVSYNKKIISKYIES